MGVTWWSNGKVINNGIQIPLPSNVVKKDSQTTRDSKSRRETRHGISLKERGKNELEGRHMVTMNYGR